MAEIVVAGELLAEFVAAERGQGFDTPGLFEGPFPSDRSTGVTSPR